MNKENILKTVERLSSLPLKEYRQNRWSHECGTPSCIAGHAAMTAIENDKEFVKKWLWEFDLHPYEDQEKTNSLRIYQIIQNNVLNGISRLAKTWLDLNYRQADILFTPHPNIFNGPSAPVISETVRVLKGLMETEEVDWSRGFERASDGRKLKEFDV